MKCGEYRFFSRRGWCSLRNMKTYADIIACSFVEPIKEVSHEMQGVKIMIEKKKNKLRLGLKKKGR